MIAARFERFASSLDFIRGGNLHKNVQYTALRRSVSNSMILLFSFLLEIRKDDNTMANFFGRVLFFAMMRFLLEDARGYICPIGNFAGCECNIMGTCNAQRDPVPRLDYKLTGYSPTGVEQFGRFIARDKQNLAYLCNDGVVAILYDCENRIPLYSATMMDKRQLKASYQRPNVEFKQSSFPAPHFQAKNSDYEGSSNVQICYQHFPNTGPALIDSDWYKALNPGKAVKPYQLCPSVLTVKGPMDKKAATKKADAKKADAKKEVVKSAEKPLKTSIHRGHLIAAQYGRGDKARILATFTYTNTIPQFGGVNSGPWRVKENALVRWGRKNCAEHNGKETENVRMFIIAGAIPSTLPSTSQERRFFGNKRFSDYQSNEFRINVPITTWTAACCTFHFNDSSGNDKQGTFHTFFALGNYHKANNLVNHPRNFFEKYTDTPIVLFPNNSDCSEEANYIKL